MGTVLPVWPSGRVERLDVGAVLGPTGAPACTVQLVADRTVLGDGTHVGAVGTGITGLVLPDGRRYELRAGMWFVVPGPAVFEPAEPDNSGVDGARVVVVSVAGWTGLFALGGPVEAQGRLSYIDGCTDTVLAAPPRLGDPCLNLLVVPPHTDQTTHRHPSLRAGIVVAGRGHCAHPDGRHELAVGTGWFIPPETDHSFHTHDEPLAVVAFHPDSDTGPTDDDHPMRNRTLID
jgi:hypothetical protein